MANVEFSYEGRNIIIQCNIYDKMEKIFQQFMSKVEANPNSIAFLYNGVAITNNNLTFDQLSNNYDKTRNKMNIIATNSSFSSPPEFIFLKCFGADESMKDYAKMTILLAFQENSDDYDEIVGLIVDKFEERYGGHWSCSLMKKGEGASCFGTVGYFIKLKYGDYKISIAKTNRD